MIGMHVRFQKPMHIGMKRFGTGQQAVCGIGADTSGFGIEIQHAVNDRRRMAASIWSVPDVMLFPVCLPQRIILE